MNIPEYRRYKGVYKSGTKFKAQLQHCGNQYYLGSYNSALEAAHAYDAKWRELYAIDPGHIKSIPNFDDVRFLLHLFLYQLTALSILVFVVLFFFFRLETSTRLY